MNPIYSVLFGVLVGSVLKQCELDQKLWSNYNMVPDADSNYDPLLTSEVSSVAAEFQYEVPPNWRDLGEIGAVQFGMLYRSSMAFSQHSLVKNGIKTVIDLRKKGTEPLFDHETSTRHHIPMVGSKADVETIIAQEIMKSPESLAEFYVLLLENGDDVLPDIFSILSEEKNYPIVFHCVAGKDRTGILAALVYSLVSVERDTIISDYSKSEHHLKSRKSVLGKYDQKLLLDGALISPSYSMKYMLEVIDKRYGSVELFLVQKIGISQDHIEALRNILTKANV